MSFIFSLQLFIFSSLFHLIVCSTFFTLFSHSLYSRKPMKIATYTGCCFEQTTCTGTGCHSKWTINFTLLDESSYGLTHLWCNINFSENYFHKILWHEFLFGKHLEKHPALKKIMNKRDSQHTQNLNGNEINK